MLSVLDRHLKLWHVLLANILALGWFAGMQIATQAALPGVKLFRCPIGMCLGYYSPNELYATLARIGRNGRQFFAETLLPLDMLLPTLLLVAFTVTYVWFSRPGHALAVPLSTGARYAFLCVPLFYSLADYAENWTLVEVLAGLSQHSLPPRAQGELPDGHQIAAGRGVDRHRGRARRRGLGHRAPLRRRCPPQAWRGRAAAAAMIRRPCRSRQTPCARRGSTPPPAARRHRRRSGG